MMTQATMLQVLVSFTIFSILPIIALGIAIISQFQEFNSYLDMFTNFY